MLLAVLEKAGVISPIYSIDGEISAGMGTVAAGYQNFIICIEMLMAAVGLWVAFPHRIYARNAASTCTSEAATTNGRNVSLQSISSNLKETMNPKDIMADAIRNFHPQYQEYTQQGTGAGNDDELRYYREYQERVARSTTQRDHYQQQQLQAPAAVAGTAAACSTTSGATGHPATDLHVQADVHPAAMPGLRQNRFTEKTNLLSSGDELP